MENLHLAEIITTSVAITQGADPLMVPVWLLILGFLCIPLALLGYCCMLFYLNKNQQIFVLEIRFPHITEKDQELYIDKMRSVFATLYSITRSQTDKVFFEVIKRKQYITIQMGSNNEQLLAKAKGILTQVRDLQIVTVKQDAVRMLSPLHAKTVSTIKEYYPITKEPHFFDNLLSYLSSLPEGEEAGVQFILRGVNKNEQMQNLRRSLTQRAVKNRRRPTDRETYLVRLYQQKQEGNMFKVKINVIANQPAILGNLTALIQGCNFEENMFFPRGENTQNIRNRFIAPDTVLSLLHEIRKYEGAYLTAQEIAYLFHPTAFTPANYLVKQTKSLEASPNFLSESNENILIGQAEDQKGIEKDIFFPIKNFARHLYIIGKTGRGKSTFLTTLITNLARKTTGTTFVFDPHGDLLEDIIKTTKKKDNAIFLNIHERDAVFTCNPLFAFGKSDNEKAALQEGLLDIIQSETQEQTGSSSSGVATFQRIKQMIAIGIEFADAYYSYLTTVKKMDARKAEILVHERQLTFNDLPYLLLKEMNYIDPIQAIFARQETDTAIYVEKLYESHMKQVAVTEAVQTRLEQLLHPSLRLVYEGNKFDVTKLTTSGKTFLLPIQESVFGSHGSRALLQSLFFLIWMQKRKQRERKDTYVFIDEFQRGQIKDIPEIIAEGRKYKLFLTLSNQQLGQIKQTIKDAIFGNMGTVISFTVGADTIGAKTLSPYFGNNISEDDLINLPPYTAYMKTEGDNNKPLATFSFETIRSDTSLANEKKIVELNKKSLAEYGEKVAILKQRLSKKKKNPLEYFLGDL